MHAVGLVREGTTFSEYRVGMIARRLQARGAQLRADGARTARALLHLAIAARDEEREAGEKARIRQVLRAHRVVVDGDEERRAFRFPRPVMQRRVLADHAYREALVLECELHLLGHGEVVFQLGLAARRDHARLRRIVARIHCDEESC